MKNKTQFTLLVSLIIIISGVLAYLSLAGSNFISNKFSLASVFYGDNVFKNTKEQCEYIDSRLKDENLRNPYFIKKYQKDYTSLKCEALKNLSNEELNRPKVNLGYFLREASSGEQTIERTNNYFLYILYQLGLYELNPQPKTTTTK